MSRKQLVGFVAGFAVFFAVAVVFGVRSTASLAAFALMLITVVLVAYGMHRLRGAPHSTALGRVWWAPLAMTGIMFVTIGTARSPIGDFLPWALEVLVGVAEVCLLALWPVKRRRAGETLLRLSRGRAQWLEMGIGAMLAVTGLTELIEGTDVVLGALALLGAPIFVLAGFVGVQFTTGGILKFELFVPWSDVRSFEWATGDGLELKVHLRRRYFDFTNLRGRTAAWPVAAGDREPLSELLRERVDASLPDASLSQSSTD